MPAEAKQGARDGLDAVGAFTRRLQLLTCGQIMVAVLLSSLVMVGNASQIVALNFWLRAFDNSTNSGSSSRSDGGNLSAFMISNVAFFILFLVIFLGYCAVNRSCCPDLSFLYSAKSIGLLVLIGLSDAVNSQLAVYATKQTPEMLQVLCSATQPIFSLMFARWIMDDRRTWLDRWFLASCLFMVAGFAIAVVPELLVADTSSSNRKWWILVYFLSMPAHSLFNVLQARYMKSFTSIDKKKSINGDYNDEDEEGHVPSTLSLKNDAAAETINESVDRFIPASPPSSSSAINVPAFPVSTSNAAAASNAPDMAVFSDLEGICRVADAAASASSSAAAAAAKNEKTEPLLLLRGTANSATAYYATSSTTNNNSMSTINPNTNSNYNHNNSVSKSTLACQLRSPVADEEKEQKNRKSEQLNSAAAATTTTGSAGAVQVSMMFGGAFFNVIFCMTALPLDALPWYGESDSVAQAWSNFVSGTSCIVSSCDNGNLFYGIAYIAGSMCTYVSSVYLNAFSPTLCSMLQQLAAPVTAIFLLIVPAYNVTASAAAAWYYTVIAVVVLLIASVAYAIWEEMEEARNEETRIAESEDEDEEITRSDFQFRPNEDDDGWAPTTQ